MKTDRTIVMAVVAIVTVALGVPPAAGQSVEVPNASFEAGQNAPDGWRCTGTGQWLAQGAAEGRRAVAVTGTGGDSGAWQSEPLEFAPGGVYCLRFRARSLGAAGGTAISGPGFCNRDLGIPPARWTPYESYFVAPDPPAAGDTRLRLGQWNVSGTVAFDDVRLLRATAVHADRGGRTLGEGETVSGRHYAFEAPLVRLASNCSRPLARHRCMLNTNRWCLAPGGEVVYRHELAGRRQVRAAVQPSVTWHAGGELLVEAGRDGKAWRTLGTIGELREQSFEVPAAMLPAGEVWVRLTVRPNQAGGAARGASLQVGAYRYTATLDEPVETATGSTRFVVIDKADPAVTVRIASLGDGLPGGENAVVAEVDSALAQPKPTVAIAEVTLADGKPATTRTPVVIQPGRQTLRIPYALTGAGRHTLGVSMEGLTFAAEVEMNVAALHDCSYGRRLAGGGEAAELWWASSGWKISRTRPAPKQAGEAVLIRAARNEAEAAQLVVRPAAALKGLEARPTPLTGPDGKTIPPEAVEVLRVRYVPVTRPTDSEGTAGDWPDPLPPLSRPLDCPAGRNQPLWVRVKVPRGAAAGTYAGQVVLTARTEGGAAWRAEVPLRVEVYGFDLPDRMTCVTSFGLDVGNIWRYHGLADGDQRRSVLDKYLANLSAHHISPYNPAPLDRPRVTWPSAGDWQGGRRDATVAHGGGASLKVDDDTPTGCLSAQYQPLVGIPPKGLRLRFSYRSAAGHRFIIAMNHYDAGGQWMSGRNLNVALAGDGQWQQFDRTFTEFPAGAKSVRLILYATLWDEQGSATGTVWFDDVSLADAGSGRELAPGGDFEPRPIGELKPAIDWTAWDAAMTRAIDHYHFNSFCVEVPGMGGGSFHRRFEPSLLGYAAETPEYQALFGGYCRAVQEHLRSRGWLDEAYVYWFDEPDPKDYAFVSDGFARLKRAAPDLHRMLTEQVEDALVGGPDIWCPLTPGYDHARAEERRRHGERFWWYVCTGPKAPYCTLFIDHPATELRVWLWQTWKRRVDGILVWQTNYWTSSSAYPDPNRPQDPYADPMGWVSGYSSKPGQRLPWGNGDGRFLYPPEAAADARPDRPVLDGPVDSIRWEMLRDGIEDYEYAAILSRLLKARGEKLPPAERARYAALLDVPESITRDMTDFTKDPAPIESRRHDLAKAIEAILGGNVK